MGQGSTHDTRTNSNTDTQRQLVLERHRHRRSVLYNTLSATTQTTASCHIILTRSIPDNSQQNNAHKLLADIPTLRQAVDRVDQELRRDRNEHGDDRKQNGSEGEAGLRDLFLLFLHLLLMSGLGRFDVGRFAAAMGDSGAVGTVGVDTVAVSGESTAVRILVLLALLLFLGLADVLLRDHDLIRVLVFVQMGMRLELENDVQAVD
jgi:hypothetical protein